MTRFPRQTRRLPPLSQTRETFLPLRKRAHAKAHSWWSLTLLGHARQNGDGMFCPAFEKKKRRAKESKRERNGCGKKKKSRSRRLGVWAALASRSTAEGLPKCICPMHRGPRWPTQTWFRPRTAFMHLWANTHDLKAQRRRPFFFFPQEPNKSRHDPVCSSLSLRDLAEHLYSPPRKNQSFCLCERYVRAPVRVPLVFIAVKHDRDK